jgi:hypothetical protein|uniref:Uncharacterized protein n=1 Tax=viral metagenome TaxID=1070528 RepID=A0A6C0DE91_9ZZZZ
MATGINTLATDTMNIDADIQGLKDSIQDALLMGDQIVGQNSNTQVVRQAQLRNKELKETKNDLEVDIRKKEGIINRTNRDFSDVKDSLPESQTDQALHVVEDYTVAILLVSYLFAILGFITSYVIHAAEFWSGLGQALLASTIFTMLSTLILYYVF